MEHLTIKGSNRGLISQRSERNSKFGPCIVIMWIFPLIYGSHIGWHIWIHLMTLYERYSFKYFAPKLPTFYLFVFVFFMVYCYFLFILLRSHNAMTFMAIKRFIIYYFTVKDARVSRSLEVGTHCLHVTWVHVSCVFSTFNSHIQQGHQNRGQWVSFLFLLFWVGSSNIRHLI